MNEQTDRTKKKKGDSAGIEDLKGTLRRDFRDIREFYLEDEQRSRLREMSSLWSWFHGSVWLFKSLLSKLTPIRRLLLFVAVFFLFFKVFGIPIGNARIRINFELFGGLVLVFILMLELKDKLLAKSELKEGRAIQTRLLPDPSPRIPGWEVWLFSLPANDVGGDLIDFIHLQGDRYRLILGDVSGKGLSAALLMVKLQAVIRAFIDDADSLSVLGERVNRVFHRDGIASSFATMAILDIRSGSGQLSLLNAGHTPPLIIRSGRVEALGKGDPALGLFAEAEFHPVAEELGVDDTILVYSDGINEARNEEGECFGNARLFALLETHARLDCAGLGALILQNVRDFSGSVRSDDDQTLLIARRKF